MKTCFDYAKEIAKGRLDDDEIRDAFQRERQIREGFEAMGITDNLEARVARAIVNEATVKRRTAATRRKQAALNVIVREKLNVQVHSLIKQGLTPRQAILTVIEGSHRAVKDARVSFARQALAYEQIFVGEMRARISREKPHILDLFTNKKFDNDVTDELYELRPGGNPGVTGNKDAQYLAKIMATYLEMSRTLGVRYGASIGHLPGYNGPQVHDDVSMLRAGRAQWIEDVYTRLDIERTFPDATSEAEVKDLLKSIHDTIITGVSKKPTAALLGQRISPANLGNRLGQHRVLHFKNSVVAREYRDLYGGGSTIGNILSHQRNMAHAVAALNTFGPNPEVMIKAVIAREEKRLSEKVTDSPKANKKLQKQIRALSEEKFQTAINQVTGLSQVPVNLTLSHVSSEINAAVSMAKLGGAVVTAIPADFATAAVASMFRGNGFWKGMIQQISFSVEHLSSEEARGVAYLQGEGYDAVNGALTRGAFANDASPGMLSRWANTFFLFNGLTKHTDIQRSASTRIISAQLGMNVAKSFDKIDWRLQHVLQLNGIGGAKWEVMRKAGYTMANGRHYLLPDSMRRLHDDQVASLVGVTGKTADEVRHNLEMDLRGYIADETTFSTLEPDQATRRISGIATQRPGTMGGMAIRSVMQFKAFPIAFANRIFGRALLGHRPGRNMGMRIINNAPHLGALMAGMTVAGYMSNLMTDLMMGRWPPRDPFSVKGFTDAFVRGGSAGIYGDFLFGEQSRYGQSEISTLIGPQLGVLENLFALYKDTRDGDTRAAQLLALAINNSPYLNLVYAKPALDILFFNSLREAASPGYLSRQERKREKDYGQSYVLPRTIDDLVDQF